MFRRIQVISQCIQIRSIVLEVKQRMDGRRDRQTDRHKCLLCVYRILFACIDITSGLAETRNLDAYVKKWMKGISITFLYEQQFYVFKWSQLGAHYFLLYLFQLLYMFRATMCPSSGELTVSVRQWYFSLYMGGSLVCCSRLDSTDTVNSPDDGHTVARNV